MVERNKDSKIASLDHTCLSWCLVAWRTGEDLNPLRPKIALKTHCFRLQISILRSVELIRN